ncbi:MAG: diflavin flavoprotein [Pseudanabaenaceae cyanobacterium bins.68]|nr:diflavin flavoprotein [Pseudanabaenaceae cyanobacterium bins.68]
MIPAPDRDVQVLPLNPHTLALRCRSSKRLRFEVEYGLERGTTANSYLLQAEQIALIDPPGEAFQEIFWSALSSRVDCSQIKYLILGHINPNRLHTVKALLARSPQITLVCSNPGAKILQSLLETLLPNLLVIKSEEYLSLGNDHQLRLIPTPTPRYADGLCTFDLKAQVLFSDKLFSAHICGDQLFDEGWQSLLQHRRYFFDTVLATQARQVESALERLQNLDLSLIAPAHGPMVRYGLSQLLQLYKEWCAAQTTQQLAIAVIYASAYGNTTTMAQAIGRGITKVGIRVESINCEHAEAEQIKQVVEQVNGIVIGSPTLGGHLPTQIQTTLGIILATANRSCPVGVFGSYGWSGEAVDLITAKLKDAGFSFGFEPIKHKLTPTAATLQMCEEIGTDFAQKLKQIKKVKMTLNPASDVEQAVGRVIGSLCVITAKREAIATAMLASWVSQATFNPPGIMVAVAKERAIESFLYPEDAFVLNILAEGKTTHKHFMKKFAPGADRLVDIATEDASNGNPILTEALAALECRVQQRMECGDHWLVYAAVENGKLLQANGLTAVHHRKTGGHY